MDAKKDMLAELDLAGLFEKRAKAAKRQKKAADRVKAASAVHFFLSWLAGGAMAMAALWLMQEYPETDPTRMFVFSVLVILSLGLWVLAFCPTESVRRLKDAESAASKNVKDIDGKIAFCHQVLEEAKKVKVQKYAQAWVEKETS